ncbi:Myosin phosphatase Rho-interacting protein [Acipenser ruthenus]|uniref:Myosin phosphatase Rho-interacting protein n=1 Tax=Acipenser ruthenus TaxID=7906 RepID=A0A662YLH9_ACIRT|nr:Myosin phosphatase Rho-interacting protein [Acipenser ruthenus]
MDSDQWELLCIRFRTLCGTGQKKTYGFADPHDNEPSTLPQGTVNMNQCTDVIDAEPKTGQKNALCIVTPEQEYFIRGESKELINGAFEVAYMINSQCTI